MTRTFQVYANLTFLGYEYADSAETAISKTKMKYGPAANWNCADYTVKLIEWDEFND
jgi:hypothetical protein